MTDDPSKLEQVNSPLPAPDRSKVVRSNDWYGNHRDTSWYRGEVRLGGILRPILLEKWNEHPRTYFESVFFARLCMEQPNSADIVEDLIEQKIIGVSPDFNLGPHSRRDRLGWHFKLIPCEDSKGQPMWELRYRCHDHGDNYAGSWVKTHSYDDSAFLPPASRPKNNE